MAEDYSFILDGFTWSFSRINSFADGCRREWKKHYIDCEEGISGFDAEVGKIVHETLEAYFKGEMTEWDLAPYVEEHYAEQVTFPCPYPNGDTKYDKVMNYFENFSFDSNKYEILGVEKKIEIKLKDKYPLVGFIDLLLKDKETGAIILQDHKTSNIKVLKNGNISKSDQEHFLAFKRQQYLYSKAIFEEYGRVDVLQWNMIQTGDMIKIDWSEEEMNEVIDWAYNSIEEINKETEYPAKPEFYYCVNLCSARGEYCPYRKLDSIYKVIYSNCFNPKVEGYETTGGCGVTMAETWVSDKYNFFKWALDNGYEEGGILNRFDIFGDYCPENCYWSWNNEEEYYEGEM